MEYEKVRSSTTKKTIHYNYSVSQPHEEAERMRKTNEEIGKLFDPCETEVIFLYYDGPLFFTLRDSQRNLYLVSFADYETINNKSVSTYLLTPTTFERVEEMKANRIDTRTAMTPGEGEMAYVMKEYPKRLYWSEITGVEAALMDYLPDPGYTLDLNEVEEK